jgi:hypothetical protein
MSDANHPDFSPGPWRQALPEPGYRFAQNGDRVVYAANGLAIAMVINDTPPDAEPNAHLIAAAPDLYDACRAALNMVETDQGPPNWDLLRAALAKAEGRA